jgi:cytochrome c oxidase assembly factor CtaG
MSLQSLPWSWAFEPPVLIGLLLAAVLYVRGLQYGLRAGLTRSISWWRVASFFGGLVAILLALESPVDLWSQQYLWAHMVQHELLIFVVPPLLLFGAPLWPIWRAIPLSGRRQSLRWFMRHPRPRRFVLAVGRFLFAPRTVWFLFVGDFLVWHLPALYDQALRNQTVHDAEHLLFLVTALLFWSQMIPSHPLKPRMSYARQAMYVVAAGVFMQFVALVLVYSGQPVYQYYMTVSRPAGALPLDVDQTTAGALMNLTGMIIFGTAFMVLTWFWLADDERHPAGVTPPDADNRHIGPPVAGHSRTRRG